MRIPRASVLLMLALGTQLHAQAAQRDILCVRAFNDLKASFPSVADAPAAAVTGCTRVATLVEEALSDARRSTFNADREVNQKRELEAMQTTRDQTASETGEKTATIEPVETAGGSVGAVGSEGGSNAVTTLSLNPSILFLSPSDKAAIAKWSRFTDFSILVPASDSDEDQDGDVDYIGVRWRVNITGLNAGDALLSAVKAAFDSVLAQSAVDIDRIAALLQSVSEDRVKPCMESLLRAGQRHRTPEDLAVLFEAAAAACGNAAFLSNASTALYTELDAAIQKARVAADRRYFGLDLRGDFGDLKRFGLDTIPGRSVTLGIGFGQRFPFLDSEASNGIRLSVGARYFEPNGAGDSRIAATGGLAYEINRYYQHQRLSLVGGFEFEADTKSDNSSRDYVAFRTALNVPLAGTTSVSLSFMTPVAGTNNFGPTLAVKANWRLLWTR